MKITLGALVLCKILVVDPSVEIKKNTTQTVTSSTNITMSQMADRMNRPQDTAQKPVQRKKESAKYAYSERIVTGIVEEIKSKRKLVEVEKNKKFKYKNYHTLLVKTKELEKLLIQADSCALANEIIEDESEIKIPKEDIDSSDKEEVESVKKEKKVSKKKVVKSSKIKKNNSDINMDEYEELKDDEILKLYKKYLEEHKKRFRDGDNSVRVVDLATGKMVNIEVDDEKENKLSADEKLQRALIEKIPADKKKLVIDVNEVKEKKKVKEDNLNLDIAKKDVDKSEDSKKEVEKKNEQIANVETNLFDFFEEKKKKERLAVEDINQKRLEEKKAEEEKKKNELKLAMIEKKKKEEVAYKKYKEENPDMILEAFKIILFE